MSNSIQEQSRESQSPQTNNSWMLSFADLLSLILTFFVMLYAMSALLEPKWNKVTSSLAKRLNPDKEVHEIILTAEKSLPKMQIKNAIDLNYLYTIISEKVKSEQVLSVLRINRYEDGLVISLPQDMLFVKGTEALTPKALEVMALLEDIFHQIGNRIDVHGYASVLQTKGQYPSNWELSLARAVSVARGLRRFGYDYEVQAFGSSDTQHQANTIIKDKENKKGLYELSHRIDIVIRSEKAAYIINTSGTP